MDRVVWLYSALSAFSPGCARIVGEFVLLGADRGAKAGWRSGFSGLYMRPDTTGTAGLLVAFCLQKKMTPQQVHSERGLVEEFQDLVRTQGVQLEWPTTHPV